VLDRAGNLWVEDYVRPGDEGPPRWNVFGPDGVQLAAVSTPPGFHIYEIGTDYLLGTWKDELDVEYVRIHALLKSDSERLVF
jgi:hypothetical protein